MEDNKSLKFIADCHLGKLAKYLRLLGFDTLYYSQIDDDDLIDKANKEHRIIISRDKELCERKIAVTLLLDNIQLRDQLQEIIKAFKLKSFPKKLTRCLICNEILVAIDKERIGERIPTKSLHQFHDFTLCPKCDKIYWHGSHYKRMVQFVNKLVQEL